MDRITTKGGIVTVARAGPEDVPDIVALLRDDEIDADNNQLLAIARAEDGSAVGTLQLTFVPGLTRGGATRLLIEGVRVHSAMRGIGLGSALFAWAHGQGRARGASLAQLTSDRRREDAHRFHERLGFERTHDGFKIGL